MINGISDFECVLFHNRFIVSDSRGSLNLNGITDILVITTIKLSSIASFQIMRLLLFLEIYTVIEVVFI